MLNNKWFKLSLKLIVSGFFVIWVVYSTNWREVIFYIRKIEIWQIVLYSALVLGGVIVCAYKWQLLAAYKGIHLPFKSFFNYYLAGTFINNFAPSFIGGDAYKAYQIGRKGKRYAEAASTVLVDRITGLFGASIMVLVFGLLNYKIVMENKILLVANLIILSSLILDLLIAKMRKTFLGNCLAALLPKKILELIREIGSFNNNSKVLLKAVLISFTFDIIGIALANYVLFLSLGIKINFFAYSSVIFIISIISSFPISINNIGIKEWAYINFFGILGVESSAAITAAILGRFLQMIISFFALPFYLESKNDSFLAQSPRIE